MDKTKQHWLSKGVINRRKAQAYDHDEQTRIAAERSPTKSATRTGVSPVKLMSRKTKEEKNDKQDDATALYLPPGSTNDDEKQSYATTYKNQIEKRTNMIQQKSRLQKLQKVNGQGKIGNYMLMGNLGEGSFGKVKQGLNIITGQKVAVKILNKKQIKQLGIFDKLKREIKILKNTFMHPHIIKIYDYIDTSTELYIVMELAKGGELFDYITQQDKLSENESRKFFIQLVSSLEYCHSNSISHRDLKPENLLLNETMNLKICDFGLCNQLKDGKFLITSCGTPNYAAPEIITANAYDGEQVDMWSSGIILYAMVAGVLPFDDNSVASLFEKIKKGRYFMPNALSPPLKDLINKLLQPLPMKRMKLSEVWQHPWVRGNPAPIRQPNTRSQIHLNKQAQMSVYTIPEYVKYFMQHRALNKFENIIDDLITKLYQYNDEEHQKEIQRVDRTEIIKNIKKKKNGPGYGYVSIYWSLAHLQMLQECFESKAKIVKLFKQGSLNNNRTKHVSDEHNERLAMISGKNFLDRDSYLTVNKFQESNVVQYVQQIQSDLPQQGCNFMFQGLSKGANVIKKYPKNPTPKLLLKLLCDVLGEMQFEWHESKADAKDPQPPKPAKDDDKKNGGPKPALLSSSQVAPYKLHVRTMLDEIYKDLQSNIDSKNKVKQDVDPLEHDYNSLKSKRPRRFSSEESLINQCLRQKFIKFTVQVYQWNDFQTTEAVKQSRRLNKCRRRGNSAKEKDDPWGKEVYYLSFTNTSLNNQPQNINFPDNQSEHTTKKDQFASTSALNIQQQQQFSTQIQFMDQVTQIINALRQKVARYNHKGKSEEITIEMIDKLEVKYEILPYQGHFFQVYPATVNTDSQLQESQPDLVFHKSQYLQSLEANALKEHSMADLLRQKSDMSVVPDEKDQTKSQLDNGKSVHTFRKSLDNFKLDSNHKQISDKLKKYDLKKVK